jgi:hypothetical protein
MPHACVCACASPQSLPSPNVTPSCTPHCSATPHIPPIPCSLPFAGACRCPVPAARYIHGQHPALRPCVPHRPQTVCAVVWGHSTGAAAAGGGCGDHAGRRAVRPSWVQRGPARPHGPVQRRQRGGVSRCGGLLLCALKSTAAQPRDRSCLLRCVALGRRSSFPCIQFRLLISLAARPCVPSLPPPPIGVR